MVIVNELNYINVDELSKMLGFMKINRLNIYYINNEINNSTINFVETNKGSELRYWEVNSHNFMIFLNGNNNFMQYNKESLYILKGGNFLDMGNLFPTINNVRSINLSNSPNRIKSN